MRILWAGNRVAGNRVHHRARRRGAPRLGPTTRRRVGSSAPLRPLPAPAELLSDPDLGLRPSPMALRVGSAVVLAANSVRTSDRITRDVLFVLGRP